MLGLMLAGKDSMQLPIHSSRWWSCFACTAALILANCEAGQGEREPSHPIPPPGSPASSAVLEIEAVYVSGQGPRTLADAKGRVVLVDFWATYCQPCRRSFPAFQALVDGFGEDLAVIAVNVQEEAPAPELIAFAAETGASFAILSDKDGATRARFGPTSLPTAYILDQAGQIRFVHPKYEGGDASKMALEIRSLILEAASAKEESE